MRAVFAKTFGGLSSQYYFRHFVFGLIFPAFFAFIASHSPRPTPFAAVAIFCINTLLYPYARFVYEGVVDFIMGRNVFYVNALLMLFVKIMTMALCWSLAVCVAPLGLLYLYFHHSKLERSLR